MEIEQEISKLHEYTVKSTKRISSTLSVEAQGFKDLPTIQTPRFLHKNGNPALRQVNYMEEEGCVSRRFYKAEFVSIFENLNF